MNKSPKIIGCTIVTRYFARRGINVKDNKSYHIKVMKSYDGREDI